MLSDIRNKSYEDFMKYTILANKNELQKEGFRKMLDTLINQIKVFTLMGEVKNLLMNTKNKIFERPLPFHNMFIDVNFFCEDISIQGLWVGDIFSPENAIDNKRQFYTDRDFKTGERLIRFYLNHLPSHSGKGIWMGMSIPIFYENLKQHWNDRLKKEILESYVKTGHSIEEGINEKELIKLFKRIQLFVNNFLDFLNHPDIETRVISHPQEMNEKRQKRGKPRIPDRVKLIIKGKLYRYLYEDNGEQKTYAQPTSSFWVRGHYMHFWNVKK